VVQGAGVSVLVDAGLSTKALLEGMMRKGVVPDSIKTVFLSHDHGDHAIGAEGIARRLGIPVYATPGTIAAMKWSGKCEIIPLVDGCVNRLGDLQVRWFPVPHDAADPVGFSFSDGSDRVSVVTDLGHLTPEVTKALRGSTEILLEANHDIEILRNSPYPWSLMERIGGRLGHLSNEACCQFIREDLDAHTRKLYLGHLSTANNRPGIVRMMAEQALSEAGLAPELIVLEN
jgi:phosphoribosyl 1,2-cyclic phosphodiesterase